MASLSKKEVRKSSKGKDKATAVKASTKPVAEEVEEEEVSSEDGTDEDEENGGVSEKGMRRLMELVGEEDLDEFERARLGAEGDEAGEGESDEEEGEEEEGEGEDGEFDEDEDEEDEEEDEDEEEEDDEEMAEDVSYTEQLAQDLSSYGLIKGADDSILISAADPDALAIDEMGSDVSLDEDAVPMRKVTANNKVSILVLHPRFRAGV